MTLYDFITKLSETNITIVGKDNNTHEDITLFKGYCKDLMIDRAYNNLNCENKEDILKALNSNIFSAGIVSDYLFIYVMI